MLSARTALLCATLAASLPAAPPAAMSGEEATMNAPATVTLIATKAARPPLERLLVDVTVSNNARVARWVLIPAYLPATQGGIDKLEQHTVSAGVAAVTVGRFLGTGGRYALLLAPGAKVTLRKLDMGWWRQRDVNEVAFDIQFADAVLLGTDPMARWFDKDPTVSGIVDADMQTARHTASHRAPGDKEVSVSMTGVDATPVKLSAP